MNMRKCLLSIIITCSILLILDLMVYTMYKTYNAEVPVQRSEGSSHVVNRVATKRIIKKGKVESYQIAVNRSFPINRTDLLSENPQCTFNKSRNRLRNFFGAINIKELPVYVDKNFLRNKKLMEFAQPFGFKEVDTHVMHVLQYVTQSSLPLELETKSCLRCVVIGNSGILRNSLLGEVIDNFDVIIRMNDAPTAHFGKDVGSRTTIRLAYPESAFRQKENYGPNWQMVIIAYKPMDLIWLHTVVQGKTMKTGEGFWKKIAKAVHKSPEEIRLLNPEVLQTGAELIGSTIEADNKNKNVPTTGFIGITMALKMCDEVSVAGFGYDIDKPKSHLHYYDGLTMDVMKRFSTHNVNQESKIMYKMVEQGIIHDITGAIKVYNPQQRGKLQDSQQRDNTTHRMETNNKTHSRETTQPIAERQHNKTHSRETT
ncbi:CMP-N-acetylneuraminate-beta-1,4-galactoside alpha-2,3-sialyltransferase-like [Apostichopus japonicus]|uniref:CMP-N-acetylneuraminate-beta-1,4-galactoside alpha-2,3-sialyltransferase-like n=1 Tax=Stichopus japonicus TaxID=307972 RepID=UPI003AB26095